jgi:uncharacterized damage-inducible protein DinB
VNAAWTAILRTRDSEGASTQVRMSPGSLQRHTVSDMVTHVTLHGAHHPGKFAADLRAAR